MKNKNIVVLAAVIFVAVIIFVLGRQPSPDTGRSHEGHAAEEKSEDAIDYWTCSMHPQVKRDEPGKCPICGMNLIPIHKSDEGKIIVEENDREILGIRSVPAGSRHMVKKLRLSGKISHDQELYRVQQEYLSIYLNIEQFKDKVSREVYERQQALLNTAELRLKLLGLRKEQIEELQKRSAPDPSLIDPTAGKAWIKADVYEQDLPQVKPGQRVLVKPRGYDKEFFGRVYAVEDVLDPQTRSAKARIEVDAEKHLKHEVFADIILEVDLGRRDVTVPVTSVIDTGTRKVIYIDEGGGRYVIRNVETGVEAGGFIEIKKGIEEGERVVTDGNFLLDSQSTLTGGQSMLYSGSEEIKGSSQQPQHRH